MALPRHRLAELVELRLVADARHVHEAHLEGRRRLLEDRVKAGLVTDGGDGDGAQARLVGGRDRAEERAERVPGDADARPVDLEIGRASCRERGWSTEV